MVSSARKAIAHSLVLLVPIVVAFIWTRSYLSLYSFQLIAFVVILYFLTQFLSKRIGFLKRNKTLFNFLLVTLVVYLIVFMTGSFYSPLFFLFYFLLFGVSLLFEPISSLFVALVTTLFLITTPRQDLVVEILQITSLFLITPLAMIFGSQYLKLMQSEEKIKILEAEEEILEKEVKNQEREVKNWTFGEFKQRLIIIWESLDSLLTDESINEANKTKIKSISQNLSQLLHSGEEMEKQVEKK